MKVQSPAIGILTGMLLLSCSPSENKGSGTPKNTDTVATGENPTITQTDTITKLPHSADLKTVDLVKQKLASMYKEDLSKKLIDSRSRKFKLFEYNINENPKKEIFVGLTGPYFCGSGGCTMLLLTPEGDLINKFTVVTYPISVGNTSTKGWKDLILHSNGQDHLMKFNGKAYPGNPSAQATYHPNDQQNVAKGLTPTDQTFDW